MSVLKRLAASLPQAVRFELEAQLRIWQLRTGRFVTDEPEFALLPDLVSPGDWVLDVGANIGHYTLELGRLVGPRGRVIAMEPTSNAFAQLARLVARTGLSNVTLLNAAASDAPGVGTLAVPDSADGLPLFYMAQLDMTRDATGPAVLTLRVDDLRVPQPVSLVKIDVEGHELRVLEGMRHLIERHHPILIVEDSSRTLVELVESWGYRSEKLEGSPNLLFRPTN